MSLRRILAAEGLIDEREAVLSAVSRATSSRKIRDAVAKADEDDFYAPWALAGMNPRTLKKTLAVLAIFLTVGTSYDYLLIERKLGSVRRNLKALTGSSDILAAFEKDYESLRKVSTGLFWG